MAYDQKLAERIRTQLEGLPLVEKKMFGGVDYSIGGNTPTLPGTCVRGTPVLAYGARGCAPGASVACGVYKEDLVVRVHPERHPALLKKPHAKPFDTTGKPMKGWLLVEPAGYKTEKQLSAWVKEGVEFASTLPPK